MRVALLAAGLGSRLGALTERLPKALIPVAGEPLLLHALRFAERLSPLEIVVVGGFGFTDVRGALDRLPAGPASSRLRLVENPRFRDGNLVSLMAARPWLGADGFLVMNVDHIYKPGIAAQVLVPSEEVTAFIDVDRALGPDDMKVARDPQGRVAAIAKTLTIYDAGYVGMTWVPGGQAGRYWQTADAVLAREGPAVHVERILAELATAPTPSGRPACRDISGFGWLEVDLPEERELAERAIGHAPADW
jgi:choline kinase